LDEESYLGCAGVVEVKDENPCSVKFGIRGSGCMGEGFEDHPVSVVNSGLCGVLHLRSKEVALRMPENSYASFVRRLLR
jgi:hypothetical protein